MIDEKEQAGRVKQLYAGEFTEEEAAVLGRIRELFQAVAEGRAQFNLIAEVVGAKVLYLIRSGFDPNVLRNIDATFFSEQVGASVPYLQDKIENVTADERDFAHDVVGAIDFALRNGVSFGFIINMLSHDLGEIFSRGSLAKTLAAHVLPKCTGYRQFTEDSVGEPEPDGE